MEKESVKYYNYPFKFDGDFINVEDTFNEDWINFYFGIGGRGIGKTYQTGRFFLNNNIPFVMCRRTEQEIKILCANDKADSIEASTNPFRQLGCDTGTLFKALKTGVDNYSIFTVDDWNEPIDKNMFCMLLPIKNVAKTKGFSIPNIDYIFMDEFIPITKVRDSFDDGYDFQQTYETIARNNEMVTGKPVKAILQANSTTIANSFFMEFGIVNEVSQMVRKGFNCLDLKDRGIRVVLFPNSNEFTTKKKETALYKAIPKNSRMYQSSIENSFILDDYTDVKKLQLAHWRPYAIIESYNYSYMIYEHVTKGFYFSDIFSGKYKTVPSNKIFNLSRDSDRLAFKYFVKDLKGHYISNFLTFCDMQSKTLFNQYL